MCADTTSDTSNQDKLVVPGRYVDSASLPHKRVIEMKESVDKSGAGTAKDIIKYLKYNEIELDMLSFQMYDFTASMSGRLNGAQKVLQDMLEQPVPCRTSHAKVTIPIRSTNIAAKQARSLYRCTTSWGIYTYFLAKVQREIKSSRMQQQKRSIPF